MSEYQYYEFRTVRRPLTREEQAEVKTWSSRGDVSATSASFVYHYSDFRQNPETCLIRCFDIMLYLAVWGSRRMMFRFPENEVDFQKLEAYQWEIEDESSIQVYRKSGFVIIDIAENREDGLEGWMEGEGILLSLAPLWTDIYKGNYACLYLIWKHFEDYSRGFLEEEGIEVAAPPIPAGMKNVSAALSEFMRFWSIDEELLEEASTASPERNEPSVTGWKEAIRKLSEEEKTEFLVRFLFEEQVMVQSDLWKHLF